jgi:hypothetical protein
LRGPLRVASNGVGRGEEVLLCEQVGVDVVVGERAVLVGPGDAVDAEAALPVVVAERARVRGPASGRASGGRPRRPSAPCR